MRPLSDPDRAVEVCKAMARLERETVEEFDSRTVREAKEREKTGKEK